MATFGNTTFTAGRIIYIPNSTSGISELYAKAFDGQISKISIRLWNNIGSEVHLKAAIYDTSAPPAKVATFDLITIPIGGDTWYEANIATGGNLAAGNYYFVLISDDGTAALYLRYDDDVSQEYLDSNWVAYAGCPPATVTLLNWQTNQKWSVYATYAPPVSGKANNTARQLLTSGVI